MSLVLLTAAGGSWTVTKLPITLLTGEANRKPLPATVLGGAAVFDYDRDGLLDIFLPNGADLPSAQKSTPNQSNRLFRNLGNFRFQDVTESAQVQGTGYDFGAAVADFDGDGDLDLFVPGLRSVTLYRNEGDGRFRDITKESGIDNKGRWAVAAVWFDLENDGDQDLFVVNYVHWDAAAERVCMVGGKPDFCHPRNYEPEPNSLFRNDGNGRFTDVSDASGVSAHKGKGMSATAADFDGDGRIDLFVTNDRVFAQYFRNRGDGRFEEVALDQGLAAPEHGAPVSGMGVDAQDYDNDGRMDLVYTALKDETFPLYRNTPKGFIETTSRSKLGLLTRPLPGWGVAFADLDNDGWKDLVVASSDALSPVGALGEAAKNQPAWFRNLGDGTWSREAAWSAMPRAMYRAAVPADFNNDGCLDVLFTALHQEPTVWRNPCTSGNHWLFVERARNVRRVRVGTQWRESASTAVGYSSSYAGPLHFGLGKETSVEVELMPATGGSQISKRGVDGFVKVP